MEVKLSFNLQHANRKNRQKVLIRSLSTPPLDSYIIFLRRWEIRDFSKTKFRDQKGRLDFITLEMEKLHKLPHAYNQLKLKLWNHNLHSYQ